MKLRPGEQFHKNPLPRGLGTVFYENLRGKRGYRAVIKVDGKRVTKRFKTQAEGYDWLREMAGYWEDTPPGETTVGAALVKWIEDHEKRNAPAKTLQAYRSGTKHLSELGGIKLRSLTPGRVQRHLDKKLAAGLSPATVRQLRNLLSGALEAAIRRGLINRNPVAGRAIVLPGAGHNEHELWSEAEQDRFIASLLEDEAVLVVAMTTGLRSGELRGLKVKDIDWEHGLLHVRRQMSLDGEADLKTHQSRRSVPLQEATERVLRRFSGRPEDLIFPIAERNLNRLWHGARERAGLSHLRLHDARAMYLTRLARNGVPPAVLKEVAGHAGLSTTMNVYIRAGVSDWAKLVREAWR